MKELRCSQCHQPSNDLTACQHHSTVRREAVCLQCRRAIHLAGMLAGDREMTEFVGRVRSEAFEEEP